ncbi:MAG: EMC3/TMCO1 family protein [Candidatus Diapherotrites archaeon]
MQLVNPMVDIAIISSVLALLSSIIQNKVMNKKQMKADQEKLKEKNKRMRELMTKNDEKSKNELESLQNEVLEIMQKMMQGTLKFTMISMVFFLPAFWLLSSLYGEAVINLPVPVPWFGNFDLFNISTWNNLIILYDKTNYLGWYILIYLVFSLIIRFFENRILEKVDSKGVAVNG